MVKHSVKLLLIEDDPIDLALAQRGFQRYTLPIDLCIARDGIEALELLKTQQDQTDKTSWLIILDLQMPRMNGFDFLTEFSRLETKKNSTVFVLTTSSNQDDIHRAHMFDIAGYINKKTFHWGPNDLQRLLSVYEKRTGHQFG